MRDAMPVRFQRLFDALCYGQLVEDLRVSKGGAPAKCDLAAGHGVRTWFSGFGFSHGANNAQFNTHTLKSPSSVVVQPAALLASDDPPFDFPAESEQDTSGVVAAIATTTTAKDEQILKVSTLGDLKQAEEECSDEEEDAMVEIDALTSVPLQLYTDMLLRAKRAKLRGQHTLRARRDTQLSMSASRRHRLHLVLSTASP